MNIFKAVVVAVALFLAPAWSFSAGLGWMRISLIEGDVQIKTDAADEWGAAALNGPLMEGDQLWVPQGGRVELQLHSGSYLRLNEESALHILSLDRDSSQFYCPQGHIYVYDNAPKGSVIQVDTPDASTRAFVNSVFRIDIGDRFTDVAVYKGYVETENRIGRTRVEADEMLSLAQNSRGEVSPMGPPDDWERWNKERNDKVFGKRGVSSRYLPPELKTFTNDFDSGGRWVNVPDYGYCWAPTIAVGIGWAPYQLGRWSWIGGDYVWISDDPWGWAPYHYGRWSFTARIGWFWVPPLRGEAYWGPGFVGWVRTGDHVAWVPLAPREIYYGRGNYGRYSVNTTTINVNQVNITNVYRNSRVNHGVTVIDHNSFGTGSHRHVQLDQDTIQRQLVTRDHMSVGAPAIKPSRESHFMSPRTIPSANQPPQPIRHAEVQRLKESHPFVRDPGKSVLNMGDRPRQMPVDTVTTPRTPGKGERHQIRLQERTQPIPDSSSPKEERPQIKPQERRGAEGEQPQPKREQPQLSPPGTRTSAPEIPPPQKRGPQVKPQERPRMTPAENSPSAPVAPPPREGRPQVKPQERKGHEGEGPQPKREQPQLIPPENRPSAPVAPEPREGKPQVKPPERRVSDGEGSQPVKERQQVKPQERKRPAPEALPSQEEKRQVEPQERRPMDAEGHVPRGERPQARPQERRPVNPEGSERK